MMGALGGLAAVLLVLLLIPVELEIALGSVLGAAGRARLSWGWGLFRVDLAREKVVRRGPKRQEHGGRQPQRNSGLRGPSFRLIAGTIRPILTLLRRLLHATHPRDVRVQAQIGFDDPADTGMFWGLIAPAVAALGGSVGHAVEVEPVFAGADFKWSARGHFTVVPAQLLGVLLAFGLSPAVVRVALSLSKGRR